MHRKLSPLFALLLVLAGCAGVPERAPPGAAETLENRAQTLAALGNYLAATQLYISESKTAPENQRSGLRLIAAQYLAQGQLWEQLDKVLASIDPGTLNPAQNTSYRLLNAESALARHQAERALELLGKVTNPESLPDHGRRYYQLRANAYAMAGNALEAARQLIWLDGLIIDLQSKLENQYGVWEQLSKLSDESLQRLRTSPPPDPLSGWMELVLITRQYRTDRQQWLAELDRWRMRYPQHAAESTLLADLLNQARLSGTQANHIAVLLPLTGRTSESAAAIRDGVMAAYYKDAPERPELRFYDTGGNAQLLWSVYQQAVLDGAEFVIGPLLKESIQQLGQSGLLPVPVLALNQTGTALETNIPLYQFGLAPEDEAHQAAEKIISDGYQRVIALAPESAWGQRVFTAFNDHFLELGGEVLTVSNYNATGADYKGPIQRALNLDASKNRHRALVRLMGQKLNFEPRRRKDVEAVFLLAFPKQGRLIRPQLRFHHAGDLPVYSTSHIFDANSDTALDRDMNGLIFCDIPWILDTEPRWQGERSKLESIWPDRSRRYQRLFALGFDAYQVVPWLDTLSVPGFSEFRGATGVLTLDQNKYLHRDLDWAQFKKGRPQLLMPREGHHEPKEDGRLRGVPGLPVPETPGTAAGNAELSM